MTIDARLHQHPAAQRDRVPGAIRRIRDAHEIQPVRVTVHRIGRKCIETGAGIAVVSSFSACPNLQAPEGSFGNARTTCIRGISQPTECSKLHRLEMSEITHLCAHFLLKCVRN